jgi:hypothetical protein
MIKKIKKINHFKIISEYFKIDNKIKWTDYSHKGSQAGLQYRIDEDPWASAVGKSNGNELDFNLLNPFFKNSIFESIIEEYNLLRTRLMWSNSFSCYSMHEDTTPRIHIPLISNTNCYFLFKDSPPQHLEPGYVYWVDTTKSHTFINCSERNRLHLIGVVTS